MKCERNLVYANHDVQFYYVRVTSRSSFSGHQLQIKYILKRYDYREHLGYQLAPFYNDDYLFETLKLASQVGKSKVNHDFKQIVKLVRNDARKGMKLPQFNDFEAIQDIIETYPLKNQGLVESTLVYWYLIMKLDAFNGVDCRTTHVIEMKQILQQSFDPESVDREFQVNYRKQMKEHVIK
ncbi:hypothetical protein WR164_01510 [Philodulcilactobacillus myokoensis]|uniref:Uncharacterized protein n=1 Tax=Philodulcilactobacillus myokoensis TaxID=2929573 RepID=A0A9W6AYW2_9LACO|nr:hypothetical protein [Philodulcilactobacillus myokoensis]GLB46172.1 hypothetical protein WR164_01510 [Philodulcilactobacillus myokoensis]